MPGSNNAAGAQPGLVPPVAHLTPRTDRYESGRNGQPIRHIVIHNTVGTDSRAYLSTTSPDKNPVSIHALVERDGTRYSIVAPRDTAWQVGDTIPGCGVTNHNSLGIELESTNDPSNRHGNGYTDAQYNTAAHCVAGWLFSFGLDFDHAVVTHASVANPPGRRHDPWLLDWPRFRNLTRAWVAFFQSLPPSAHGRYII